ncbi:hypothetical protein ACCC84_10200 [Serratia odorifera]|uniref:hypothetical protein n=1 Tax=Serratia odorifera TaxID=618 RepID=UPI003531D46A
MERHERISYLVPFNSEGELITPQTTYELSDIPSEINLKIAVGFVNLLPASNYKLVIKIIPQHISIAVGETVDVSSYPEDIATMNINTKGTILSEVVNGSVDVTIDKVKIVAKGSYSITATLRDDSGEVHSQTSYFYCKISK